MIPLHIDTPCPYSHEVQPFQCFQKNYKPCSTTEKAELYNHLVQLIVVASREEYLMGSKKVIWPRDTTSKGIFLQRYPVALISSVINCWSKNLNYWYSWWQQINIICGFPSDFGIWTISHLSCNIMEDCFWIIALIFGPWLLFKFLIFFM